MSLIGQKIKANIVSEEGANIGFVEGVVIEKVIGLTKRRIQRLRKDDVRIKCDHFFAVDFYLLETEDGLKKAEASQVVEIFKEPESGYAYSGPE